MGDFKENANQLKEQVYRFVRKHIGDKGFAPTYNEINVSFQLNSRSHVQHILKKLDEEGRIILNPGVSRGITLPERGNLVQLPFVGSIAAGIGIDIPESDFSIYDPETTISVPLENIGSKYDPSRTFALRVEGDSMRDDMVLDRDIIIVERVDSWQNGDMIAVWIKEEKTATLKRLYLLKRGSVELRPSNPAFRSRVVSEQEIEIQGKVLGLLRNYTS
jgi:repressor LexA